MGTFENDQMQVLPKRKPLYKLNKLFLDMMCSTRFTHTVRRQLKIKEHYCILYH